MKRIHNNSDLPCTVKIVASGDTNWRYATNLKAKIFSFILSAGTHYFRLYANTMVLTSDTSNVTSAEKLPDSYWT